jgi:hypothetical protein
MRLGIGESQQNWFRPENRFPSRVFGSMVPALGESSASVRGHIYFAVPRRPAIRKPREVQVVPYDFSHLKALGDVASLARVPLYVAAEELDRDVELRSVDRLYRAVGLRRTRHVWLAYRAGSREPLGAALAYRGPLGLNFSFLENRCDLLLSPGLPPALAVAVTSALMHDAADAYADFELDDIPVVADAESAPALAACGGQTLRNYCQGIWLMSGQPALIRHIDGFYTRILNRVERRGAPSARIA